MLYMSLSVKLNGISVSPMLEQSTWYNSKKKFCIGVHLHFSSLEQICPWTVSVANKRIMKNIVQFSISLTSLYVYYDGFLMLIFKYDQQSNVSFALLFLILISIVTVISWLCTSVSALIVFCIFLPGRRWLRFPLQTWI